MKQFFQKNSVFSSMELNSLRFYQGDVEHYCGSIEKYSSDFYKTKSAYQILNMILYPGLNNEKARICKEHKNIPIHLLENLKEFFVIYEDIFRAMCKYRVLADNKEKVYLYRKDRIQSMEALSNDHIVAWTSCSVKNEIDDSFKKKDGILLLEYEVPSNIPYIVMNDVLGENKYQDQEEVLLPPFLLFEKSTLDMNHQELSYTDINGNPPKAKYLLKIKKIDLCEDKSNICMCEEVENYMFDEHNITQAIMLLEKMYDSMELTDEEIFSYCKWKEIIHSFLRMKFIEIYEGYGDDFNA